jgi:hypothetical protein
LKLFKRLFGIDLRSLALFRMALGACILGDLANRATSLEAHYTDFGVLPRSVVIDSFWNPANVSLHLINGTFLGQAILFLTAAIFGAMLMVGFYTRLATVVSWFLLISLQVRNPMILQGGDILFRSLLLWAMFLPLGARWSWDSVHGKRVQKDLQFFRLATMALLLQVAVVYWGTAALKSGKEWIPDGTAIYYALHIEEFAKPFGAWIRQFPELMRWLTYGVWGFEVAGPFLLFLPVFFLPFRLIGIAGFWGLHLGLFFSMELGIFPFISSIAMIPFIPPEVWAFVSRRIQGQRRAVEEFRVGLARWLGWLSSFLLLPTRLVWAGSSSTEYRALTWQDLRAGGGKAELGTESEEAISVGKRTGGSWFAEGLCALLFVYMVFWNLAGVPAAKVVVPPGLRWVADLLRLDQYWDMFAPYPAREDGWWVIPGTLEDESTVDVLHQTFEPPSWEEPARISAGFPNDRWRSYYMMIWLQENESYRLYYAKYLCRLWNRSAPEGKHLKGFDAYFMSKPVLPDYLRSVPEKVLTWEQDCDL